MGIIIITIPIEIQMAKILINSHNLAITSKKHHLRILSNNLTRIISSTNPTLKNKSNNSKSDLQKTNHPQMKTLKI
jgi:hypothetical protein